MRNKLSLIAVFAATLALAACGNHGSTSTSPSTTGNPPAATTDQNANTTPAPTAGTTDAQSNTAATATATAPSATPEPAIAQPAAPSTTAPAVGSTSTPDQSAAAMNNTTGQTSSDLNGGHPASSMGMGNDSSAATAQQPAATPNANSSTPATQAPASGT